MLNHFHKLKVIALANPIDEATCITFKIPPNLYESYNYYPGQHLIMKFVINGEEVRRSYSLNSSPFIKEALQVTVKRVQGGLVSNFVADHLKVGDELDVMTPQGRFLAEIDEDAYKSYFLFAAGSGITPIISILKSVLVASPKSVVNFLYGNANQNSIIFKEELDNLQNRYPKRFRLIYTLSKPKLWSSWEQWKGRKGRIDKEAVEWFITNHPPIAQSTEYYICGPGAMNVSVRDTLIELGVPKELVYIEQFGGSIETLNDNIKAVENAKLSVSLNGQSHHLTVPKGKTILQVLKSANAEPPYSCESGVCGTCVAKLTKGKADMKACMALSEKDIEQGAILTCQAIPTTTEINIIFEE